MEGPQTHALAAHLGEWLCGRPIERIDLPAGRWQANVLLLNCAGQVVQRVRGLGKWLVFDLSHGVSWACRLLGRSGWRVWAGPDSAGGGGGHTEPLMVLTLRNGVWAALTGRPLFLILPTETLLLHAELKVMGPDPLAPGGSFHADFPARLRAAPGRTVAAALLDQGTVAGLGNGLKCEVLFAARLHPMTRVADLLSSEINGLASVAQSVCARHLQHHLAIYAGRKARDERVHWVYDRAGEACRTCGTGVAVERCGGDGHWTWYCPQCQQKRSGAGLLFG